MPDINEIDKNKEPIETDKINEKKQKYERSCGCSIVFFIGSVVSFALGIVPLGAIFSICFASLIIQSLIRGIGNITFTNIFLFILSLYSFCNGYIWWGLFFLLIPILGSAYYKDSNGDKYVLFVTFLFGIFLKYIGVEDFYYYGVFGLFFVWLIYYIIEETFTKLNEDDDEDDDENNKNLIDKLPNTDSSSEKIDTNTEESKLSIDNKGSNKINHSCNEIEKEEKIEKEKNKEVLEKNKPNKDYKESNIINVSYNLSEQKPKLETKPQAKIQSNKEKIVNGNNKEVCINENPVVANDAIEEEFICEKCKTLQIVHHNQSYVVCKKCRNLINYEDYKKQKSKTVEKQNDQNVIANNENNLLNKTNKTSESDIQSTRNTEILNNKEKGKEETVTVTVTGTGTGTVIKEKDNKSNNYIEKIDPKIAVISESEKLWKELDLMKIMVKCPAGSFIMGSPLKEHLTAKEFIETHTTHENDFGFAYNENQHEVVFTKDFYIGKYPVTQSLYERIMNINPAKGKFKNVSFPAISVSWDESKSFCEQLNSLFIDYLPQGYKFDLPTEAQWEYACRAGTTTPLNNGQYLTSDSNECINLDEIAWYYGNFNKELHSVGYKKPNNWNIYEMSGFVSEWCLDFYGKYPKESVENYVCLEKSDYRVIRGSFMGMPFSCRSASRAYFPQKDRNEFIGFRIALVPIKS